MRYDATIVLVTAVVEDQFRTVSIHKRTLTNTTL
jgi:hypothetical protein